jgi:glycosyltransferase involved in cell wall biosynthesis
MADSGLHPLHRLWRAMPVGARRRLLARGSALLAPRPDQPPPPVLGGMAVAGEVTRASGLGEAARLMLAGLERLGVPGWGLRAGLRLPGESEDVAVADSEPPPGAALALHVNAPQLAAALLRLGRGRLRGRRVIGCWAWELPVAPPDWRAGVGFVHEVWAPSRFTAAALEPLLPGRVRVVPYSVACRPPAPAALDRAAFGLPTDAVVVLTSFNLASSFERKNPLAAIAAHQQAFGARADRILLMKVGHPGHYPADLQRLKDAAGGAANIRFETRTLPPADNDALTACADIVLSLHRSEGFGLVPAEGMLLGRPVIATNWSGNIDFMDDETSVLVPYRLVPAVDPRGVFQAQGAVWAEADVGVAAEHLRRLADDPAARAALGARAQRAAQTRLGAEPLAAALRGLGLVLPGDAA